MANPTQDLLTNAQASGLSDTVHPETGGRYMPEGQGLGGDPNIYARFMATHKQALDLIGKLGGAVIDKGGLNAGVFALNYAIAGVSKAYPGDATFLLTANATNYLYLDTAQTLKTSITAWPAGDHFRLATVVTNATDITAIIDARFESMQIGLVNRWSAVAAQDPVDMAGFSLGDLGEHWLAAATELTIATGSITTTATLHTVDTEADAASDDLITLTADAAKINRVVILRAENAARVVTVKSTGNLTLVDGDLVLDSTDKLIVLLQNTATTFVEMYRNYNSPKTLAQNVDANLKNITNVGILAFQAPDSHNANIVAGAITLAFSMFALVGETTTDDLDTINGSVDGGLIIMQQRSSSGSLTVKHLTGNIKLANGVDMVFGGPDKTLVLYYDGAFWVELARTYGMSDLVGTGEVIPYSPGTCHYPGTLADAQATYNAIVTQPFTLKKAHGYVSGVPVTTACNVDVLKNGASVFASPANAIVIAAAANEDTSDTITVGFNAGDRLTVKVLTASAAAGLTVTLDGYTNAANP